jgi:hypothetical protein
MTLRATPLGDRRLVSMRPVKTTPVLLALALVALDGGGTAVGARHRKPICVRYKCRTLAATAQIRVFQATNKHPAREVPYLSSFARWLPSGRVTPLGDGLEQTQGVFLERLALAGRFVADASTSVGKETMYEGQIGWSVSRLNVETGRQEHARVPFTPSELDPNRRCNGFVPEGAPGVTDIAVTANGTVAWIVGGSIDNNLRNLSSRTVCELPPGSSVPLVVASDPSIRPKSLAAIPGHLYWIEGTTPRNAVIR